MNHDNRQINGILDFLRPYRKQLLGLVGLTVLLSILIMLPPLLVRAVIDRVITEGDRSVFPILAVLMLTLPVLLALMRFLQSVGIAAIGQRFVFDVRILLYNHLLNLSLRFYSRNSVGKVVNRLMGDSGVVQRMLTAQSIMVVSDFVCAAFAISATFAINWRLGLVLFLIITTFVGNYRINIKRIRLSTRGYKSALDRVSGGVQNRLGTALAVKTFGTELREQQVFRNDSGTSMSMVEDAQVATNSFSMNTQLIQGLGRAVIYFLGCAFVLKGEMSYGDVVAFTAYAMQLLLPAVRFSELAKQIQDVSVAVERLFELFKEAPEITEKPDAREIKQLSGKVHFEHVHFHYEPATPVIKDFHLHVEPGQTVALIGPTGCGKSTILSLLMRFFDVTGGQLLLDGIDIRELKLFSLRKQFGIVLQDPLLFNISITENIRFSRPDATMEEIEAAAKVAEIHDFILTLPDGYETELGREGVELSVGQKQRITIARAVVSDPAILIMDEATSSLDSDSEQAIQRAMDRVLKNRTCFVVAHRLSTIRNADRIVLLDQGIIAEIGNHDELMQKPDGRYRDLYLKHMGAGVLEE